MKRGMLIAGMATQIPLEEDLLYIGIDKGAFLAYEQQIPLLCAIGDFDSITLEQKEQLAAYTTLVQLPAHKDETDSEQAIFYALQQGFDELILYGGLGGRMDHCLANMALLTNREYPLILQDEYHYIKVLKEGMYKIPKRFQYLSFLALQESCISETGVAYPLIKRDISPTDIYSISNEILDDFAQVEIHKGRVLMIQCMDADK